MNTVSAWPPPHLRTVCGLLVSNWGQCLGSPLPWPRPPVISAGLTVSLSKSQFPPFTYNIVCFSALSTHYRNTRFIILNFPSFLLSHLPRIKMSPLKIKCGCMWLLEKLFRSGNTSNPQIHTYLQLVSLSLCARTGARHTGH